MSLSPDVVVVGGGIVGLCAAIAAADRGMRVTVVDDGHVGAASRSSAGMLGPSLPGLPESLRDLSLAARDIYPEFLAQLSERSGVEVALDRSGILEIATSGDELEALERRGHGAARLDQRELAALEPALAPHAGALHHPLDGWVDNRALMDALWISAERHERIDLIRGRVAAIEISADAASVMLVDGRRLACRRMVSAAGAWAAELPGLPTRVPVRPVKGELLTLADCGVRHVVYGSAGYVLPRGDTLLVGATSEDRNFDPAPSPAGREFLLSAAATLLPLLSEARVVEHWGGLRPMSPDGLPILGEDANSPALVHACGFSRNGILLAPWAGNALAALLAGEAVAGLPGEFEPGRFGQKQ